MAAEDQDQTFEDLGIPRPRTLTPERERSLLMALAVGLEMETAANIAGLSTTAIARWRREFAWLDARISNRKARPVFVAASMLMRKVAKGDLDAIKFLLSRRAPEFRDRQTIEIETPEERAEKIAEALAELEASMPPAPSSFDDEGE